VQNIGRLESSYPEMQAKGVGYIVSPSAEPQSPIHYRDKQIHVISGVDIDQYTQFAPVSRETTEQQPEQIPIEATEEDITETTEITTSEEASEKSDLVVESDTPSTDEVEVSSTTQVILGERKDTGDDLIWKGSVEGSPHIFVLGSTGAGKSTTVRRLLRGLVGQGIFLANGQKTTLRKIRSW
jgi:flagellar biosynthesis GTPase FlhF